MNRISTSIIMSVIIFLMACGTVLAQVGFDLSIPVTAKISKDTSLGGPTLILVPKISTWSVVTIDAT